MLGVRECGHDFDAQVADMLAVPRAGRGHGCVVEAFVPLLRCGQRAWEQLPGAADELPTFQ